MKITLELELSEDSCQLTADLKNFANTVRAILLEHKKQYGVEVPTLAVRGGAKSEKETKEQEIKKAYKIFSDTLLDRHLLKMPNSRPIEQVRSIRKLYDMGLTAEQCINLYDKHTEEYPMTSWLTVVYFLNKGEKIETETKVLTEAEKQSIKDKLKKK